MSGVAVEKHCDADAAWPPAAGLPSLLRMALPLVVSRAGLAAMVVADGWMIARHDAGQLAVNSLANGTFGRLTEVFASAVMSGLPLVAAATAGRLGDRTGLWRRAALTALGLGFAGIGIAACAPPLLSVSLGEPALVRGAVEVVWILGLGLPAGLVALAAAMYLEGCGRPGLVAAWVVAANALNIALNGLLIGGQAGFPAWGAYGSGLGTTIVRTVLAAALVLAVWRLEGRGAFAPGPADRTGARAQWRLALGAGSAVAGFHASAVWLTFFAGWLGPEALAAFASCWILTMPAVLLSTGIGDAIGLRVARTERAGTLRHDLSALALLLVPFQLILWSAPGAVAALYTPDPALRGLIASLLPLGGVILVLDGLSYGLGAVLRARGDVIGSTAIQLGTLAATPVLAGLLAFRGETGLHGLMLAILATSLLRLAFLAHRLRRAATPRFASAP